ncbi:peptidase M24 [Desulfotomaculum nigrificans CO-1-SRB]|uniref:Peptidase M24 n=1 Tax=Desulfotomaculum nigrificans (strain DSM 14880 / VKM B-2319 / CO-1-SRB) TaxID=868595 RepID=F6B8T3_DESCC|nr:Xaa-Pro peptidase family protein [Desulfotomaculum nigrificans]AEF94776.1 peptidase M24 [Desulfotomaculum nigrificans CO-1-SRB]
MSIFQSRVKRVQDYIKNTELDLLLVVGRENLIYFTGLTQIECMAILIPKEGEACAVTLWLDAGYVQQESGIKTYGYVFPKENLASKVVKCIKNYGMNKPVIGFERYFVDFAMYDEMRKAFPEAYFTAAGDILYKIRSVKDEQEINYIKQAAYAVCCGVEAAVKAIKPGVTELELLAEAEYAMIKAGSAGSPFRPQIVSGDRTLLTHPCSSDRKINSGEIVVIHLGATYRGYCAKMCRTVALGQIPREQEQVYELLLEAQQRAIDELKPGVTADSVDRAAREIIEKAGYQRYYLDYVGYGVGLRQSEFYPIIGKGRNEVIEAGMVVDLLLPTIYLQGIGGPRVTDVIHVGEKTNEILTDYPRELIRL